MMSTKTPGVAMETDEHNLYLTKLLSSSFTLYKLHLFSDTNITFVHCILKRNQETKS